MRVHICDSWARLVFSNNSQCLRCHSPLGYVHQRRDVVALTEVASDHLVDMSSPVRAWQRCATQAVTGCNWLVPAGTGALCESCTLTRTRPADNDAEGMAELLHGEMAKRRLIFHLAELGLPIVPRDEQARKGLAFDLLSSSETKVITGHDNG